MQEEVNQKVIAISIQTTKLTAKTLQQALKIVADQIRHRNQNPRIVHGKQSIRQLMRQNTPVSNIEITDGNIRAFEDTAKKYGIDYAVRKDISAEPTRYLVFFKGRDADVMTAAFHEFSTKQLTEQEKPSLRKLLSEMKAKETVKEQSHEKIQNLKQEIER